MTQNAEYVIETKGLSKSFGKMQALRGVDLRVPRHSIFGFLGPNGAGKTTLMKALLGLSRPTAGGGTIFGHDIVGESVLIRERIGYLPQQPRFIEYMTARENLQFAAKFFFNGPQAKIRERCDEMLELVGLAEKADRPTRGFSGGEKQRLGIALAQVNYSGPAHPGRARLGPGPHRAPGGVGDHGAPAQAHYHFLLDPHPGRCAAGERYGRHSEPGATGRQRTDRNILNGKNGVVYSLALKGNTAGLSERFGALPWVTHATVTTATGPASGR